MRPAAAVEADAHGLRRQVRSSMPRTVGSARSATTLKKPLDRRRPKARRRSRRERHRQDEADDAGEEAPQRGDDEHATTGWMWRVLPITLGSTRVLEQQVRGEHDHEHESRYAEPPSPQAIMAGPPPRRRR